jgi:hypothetical protein
MSWATGLGSWFGELMLFFGVFALVGSGQFLLAGIGAIVVFLFEGLAVNEKPNGNEIKELAEFPATAVKNLFFPALWMVLFFLDQNGFILAFAITTGIKAVALNAKLVAKSFMWADGKTL